MELNLSKISNKEYRFVWDALMYKTDVEITIPNLKGLKYSVWGDWGPLYNFELNEFKNIKIKYNNDTYDSDQKVLAIDSPMLYDERQIFPFYIVIEDARKSINFHLYIDNDYNLGKVEIVRSTDRVKLFQTVKEDYLSLL